MDKEILALKGSEKRDLFKWAHKNKMQNASFYASDFDLVLVTSSAPWIVAYLDYKGSGEKITYTECIVYDVHMDIAPVYIVRGADPKNGPFEINRYTGNGNTAYVCGLKTWNEFLRWEAGVRQARANAALR